MSGGARLKNDRKKWIITTILTLLTGAFIANLTGYLAIANLLIVLLTVSIWFAYKYLIKLDEIVANNQVELAIIANQKRELQNELTSLKDIHDGLATVFFSYHILKKEMYISKGIERFTPYSNDGLMENPLLVKQVIRFIHEKFESDLNRLLLTGKRGSCRYEINDRDHKPVWIEIEINPLIDEHSGQVYCVRGMIFDISKEKQFENKLKQMAYYDELTDLPNRKLIQKHINKTLARSRRHNHCFSVMFIDLDGFKSVNDTFGHDAGDQLLILVANRLNNTVREEDLTGRLGGDEFMIVFEETNKPEVELIAERILTSIAKEYTINQDIVKVSPSIGISMYPKDGEDIETLINNADKAMYFAKNNGKNNFQFYEKNLEEVAAGKFQMFEKLMNTVTQSDFFQSVKSKF